MKLRFEKWLEDQNFSEEAFDVFGEAVVCYKASAYRSALLMSYVGFLTIIRDRLMEKPDIPTGFTELDWKNNVLNSICDPEKWEQGTYELIKRSQRPIFNISDDLRKQIEYWKDRRNDCAHNKRNMITYSHVESFWAFLISNQDKISVKGSINELLNRIESFFDISKTPAYEPFNKLLEDITFTVANTDEIRLFVPQMVEKMCKYQNNKYIWTDRNFDFLNELFLINGLFSKEFIKYFKDHNSKDILLEFLRHYPVHTNSLSGNNELIREIWYSLLYNEYGILEHGSLPIYCSLLVNNLIPETELRESFEKLFFSLTDGEFTEEFCEIYYPILDNSGFFKLFDEVFSKDKNYSEIRRYSIYEFGWANRSSLIISTYLEHAEITEELVDQLYTVLPAHSNYPWVLRRAVDNMFTKHPDKIKLIKKIIEEKNLLKPRLTCLDE